MKTLASRHATHKQTHNTMDLEAKEYVLTAMKNTGSIVSFKHANARIRDDREVLLAAFNVSNSWEVYKYASERLRDDRELTLRAILIRRPFHFPLMLACPLKYASDRLQDDEEIVKAYACMRASSITYASERLQNDVAFMLEIVETNPDTFYHVNTKMRNNKQVAIVAIKAGGYFIAAVDESLREDKDLLILAMRNDVNNAKCCLTRKVLNDPEIMIELAAIPGCGKLMLQLAGPDVKDNFEVVATAISDVQHSQACNTLIHASDRFRTDPDVMKQVYRAAAILRLRRRYWFKWIRRAAHRFIDAEKALTEALSPSGVTLAVMDDDVQLEDYEGPPCDPFWESVMQRRRIC